MRVLILYTELAGYVTGNISRFMSDCPEASILLLHYPVHSEAPFRFRLPEAVLCRQYSPGSEAALLEETLAFDPEMVLCSGWGNPFYLKIVSRLPARVRKVLCFDNPWKATLKQRALTLFSRFWLLRSFRFAWVPGDPQKAYALRLGFRPSHIFTGLYPADSALFSAIGRQKLSEQGPYPRVMLSVARYIAQKDLPTLWQAFTAANRRSGLRWRLDCIGQGELFPQRQIDPHIRHLGFKQPAELEPYILGAGVYVLPSIEEPWAVAVHEMALSALPLVLSDRVGAGSLFLNRANGFVFPAGNAGALEEILLRIMCMEDDELRAMAAASYASGMQLQSAHWTETLLKMAAL